MSHRWDRAAWKETAPDSSSFRSHFSNRKQTKTEHYSKSKSEAKQSKPIPRGARGGSGAKL